MATFEFPNVMSINKLSEEGRAKLATNVPLVRQALNLSYNGVVTEKGEWAVDTKGKILFPGAWKVTKYKNTYKVEHNLGYTDTSLSVSLLQSPGSFKILEHHPRYFVIETILNGKLTDMAFMFTLNRIISPRR